VPSGEVLVMSVLLDNQLYFVSFCEAGAGHCG